MRDLYLRGAVLATLGGLLLGSGPLALPAGELTVDVGMSRGITFVGAIRRWDDDGQPLKPVDPRARIDRPEVNALARSEDGRRWVFRDLPSGRYDLVILAGERIRVEGFDYAASADFEPSPRPDAGGPDAETRDTILADIAASRHYENKVMPLFLAGDEKQVRTLVQLVRNAPTSFDSESGAPVATIRHEIWRYTKRRGAWLKDRQTKVLDRILLPRDELRRWTWVWEPGLGGIEVREQPVLIPFTLPERFDRRTARGWFSE